MPELPEVETVKRILSPQIEGKTIVNVKVYRDKNILNDVNDFSSCIKGETFLPMQRRGKFLIFPFASGKAMISHLRMEGKYRVEKSGQAKQSYDIVAFELNSNETLVYFDTRKFGIIELFPSLKEANAYLNAKLGPEPSEADLNSFFNGLKVRNDAIKEALLDQKLIAGIGNIYDSEILFRAKIHPLAKSSSLSKDDANRILKASREILNEAIEEGGSTIKSYHPSEGVDGRMQSRLLVYGKAKQPCPNCGTNLSSIFISGRSSVFCPVCQHSPSRSFVLGITGPIHAGKSTAASYFKSKGYACFDADKTVWALYETDKVKRKIVELLGKHCIQDGKVYAKAMRQEFAAHPEKKNQWEHYIDPLLVKEAEKQIENSDPSIPFLLDVPRLFNSGLGNLCDVTILVDSEIEHRAKRLLDEGKDADAMLGLNGNYPIKLVKKKASFCVLNNGTKEEFAKLLSSLPLPRN